MRASVLHTAFRGRLLPLLCTFMIIAGVAERSVHAKDLVIEAWTGAPTEQEREWVEILRVALVGGDFLATPAEIIRAMGERVPLAALSDFSIQDDLVKQIGILLSNGSTGADAFRKGNFQSAEKLVVEFLEAVRRNPALFTGAKSRAVVREALAALMLSRSRLRKAEGVAEAAAELVRTFPGEESKIHSLYGGSAEDLYKAAYSTLQAQGRGALLIDVDDPTALVYVNEGAPSAAAFEGTLLPGPYRVLVQTARRGARRYEVTVKPGQQTRLSIKWKVDGALAISEGSIALIHDSDLQRENEGKEVARLAQALGAGPKVIVIGSGVYANSRVLVASAYSVETGEHVYTGLVVMDGRDHAAKLQALSAFLLGGGAVRTPDVVVLDAPLPSSAASAKTSVSELASNESSSSWKIYFSAIGTVATFGTGVYMMYLDKKDHMRNQRAVRGLSQALQHSARRLRGVCGIAAIRDLRHISLDQSTHLARGAQSGPPLDGGSDCAARDRRDDGGNGIILACRHGAAVRVSLMTTDRDDRTTTSRVLVSCPLLMRTRCLPGGSVIVAGLSPRALPLTHTAPHGRTTTFSTPGALDSGVAAGAGVTVGAAAEEFGAAAVGVSCAAVATRPGSGATAAAFAGSVPAAVAGETGAASTGGTRSLFGADGAVTSSGDAAMTGGDVGGAVWRELRTHAAPVTPPTNNEAMTSPSTWSVDL